MASSCSSSSASSSTVPYQDPKFIQACEENNLECPVCYEPFNEPSTTQKCIHVFCKACLINTNPKNCPLCRCEYTVEEITIDLIVQTKINNIRNQCLGLEQKTHETTALAAPSMSVPDMPVATTSSSSSCEAVESSVSTHERLKFSRIVQLIFTEIADDQSTAQPIRPTFKTTWSPEQSVILESLREFWNGSWDSSDSTMGSFLDTLEEVAIRLSEILKIQQESLHIVGNSSRRSVTHVLHGGNVRVQQGGGIVVTGGIDPLGLSRLVKLSLKLQNGTESLDTQNDSKVFIGDHEVKREEANFYRALRGLEELLLECFSKRFQRREFVNTFNLLAKMNSKSDEKQHNALISLCGHCNDLLQEGNRQALIGHYNRLSQDEDGIVLLGRMTELLITFDKGNREKLQDVIAKLEEISIDSIKSCIDRSMSSGQFEEDAFRLLYICPAHQKWCIDRISEEIKFHINKKNEELAARLNDQYLRSHEDEAIRTLWEQNLDQMILKNINNGRDYAATPLIDNYLLRRPEGRRKGMEYIRTLIRRNIYKEADYAATPLIDKYFLSTPDGRKVGMKYIRRLIRRNIEKEADYAATPLIDKYFLSTPDGRKVGMKYIRTLIRRNIDKEADYAATPLIDKYFLSTPEGREEGIKYIRELIQNNIDKDADYAATPLIDKYFLSTPERYTEGIGFIRALIQVKIKSRDYDTVNQLKQKYRIQ